MPKEEQPPLSDREFLKILEKEYKQSYETENEEAPFFLGKLSMVAYPDTPKEVKEEELQELERRLGKENVQKAIDVITKLNKQ